MMMNDSVPTATSEICTLKSTPTHSGNFVNELNCSQEEFSDGFVTSTDKVNDLKFSQGGLFAGVVSGIALTIILVGIVIFIVVFIRLRNGRKSSEVQNEIG